MKKILIISILIISALGIFAQQIPINDQYYTNGFFVNPAKAGTKLNTSAFLFNRQQWTSIQGAPQTSLFSIDGARQNKKVGLGLTISNDKDNIFSKTSAYGTYAYHLKITDNQQISLGASAGLMNLHIAFDDIKSDNSVDPILLNADANKINFDANFGVNYTFKKLEVGLIAYQLAGTHFNYTSQTEGKDIDYQLIQHFMGIVNYTFTAIPDKLTVTPSVMLRTTLGITPQIDASVMLKYNNKIWTNIGWRQNACAYISLGSTIYDNIVIGGAYEYNIGSISKFSGSSFEVIIGYKFNKGNVQTTSSTNYSKSDINQLKKIAQQQSEKIDKLSSDNKKLNREINKNNAEITKLKEEIVRLKANSKLSTEDKNAVEKFKEQHEVKSFNSSSNDNVNNNFESYNYCVIVGAYKTIKNAKLGQKILKRELDLQTYLIKKPKSSFYYVATDFFDNSTDVTKEHKRLKELGIEKLINGKTWVYMAE